jgi:3-phosphoshikimate 1-carboxyvinyltransferase
LLDALRLMGASIEVHNERTVSGEPVADLTVRHSPLQSIAIGPDLALRAIDEIPLLAIAAAFADGQTTISGIRELRAKESDRIAATQGLLSAIGIETIARIDGLAISSGPPAVASAPVATHDDHRIAMAAAVLACGAGPLAIDSDASIDVSFPNFLATLAGVRT